MIAIIILLFKYNNFKTLLLGFQTLKWFFQNKFEIVKNWEKS
jgi:hypothetical protein